MRNSEIKVKELLKILKQLQELSDVIELLSSKKSKLVVYENNMSFAEDDLLIPRIKGLREGITTKLVEEVTALSEQICKLSK